MSDQYYGEIRMFAGWGGTMCILNWAFCDGTELQIADNGTLYSLLGTTWGGNGMTTFKLPDMRGRVPIHYGQGPGLTNRYFGFWLGNDYVQLTTDNLPPHNHPAQGSTEVATESMPSGCIPGTLESGLTFYDDPPGSIATNTLSPHAVADAGCGMAHENCMPTTALSFIIALKGTYPDRP